MAASLYDQDVYLIPLSNANSKASIEKLLDN